MTKGRACKGAGQEWSLGVTVHASESVGRCEGMNPHTPSGLPLWELESQWTSKSSKSNCKGQNSLDWRIFYTIKKLLKHKFLKWACKCHLSTWNTSYGQKKGQESNCQFESRPLKVRNRPDLLACKWHVTYYWKALDGGYNVYFKPHFNRRSTHKVMDLQSYKSPNFENFETPTRESRNKMTFGC